MPRVLKQILYGLLYLSILAIVAWLFWISRPADVLTCTDGLQNQNETGVDCGGPCEDCELRDLRLVIGGVDMVGVGGKTSFVVKVENSSRNFGVSKAPYQFDITTNEGNSLGKIEGQLNIGVREEKYIAAVGFDAPLEEVGEVTFSIGDFEFVPEAELTDYDVEIKNIVTTFPEQTIKTRGTITNDSGFVMSEVVLTALFYSEDGKLANIGSANISNLQAFETRDFLISVPRNDTFTDPDLTEVFWRII